MRLLLIEDSARLRSTLQKGLSRAGYAVDAAQDGREGLWLATENEYDVIVLDLMLPEIDGLTVLERLRARGKATHVLILSAKDRVEDRVRGLSSRGGRLPGQALLLRRALRPSPGARPPLVPRQEPAAPRRPPGGQHLEPPGHATRAARST